MEENGVSEHYVFLAYPATCAKQRVAAKKKYFVHNFYRVSLTHQ